MITDRGFLQSVLARVVAAREAEDVCERDAILSDLESDLANEIERTPERVCLDDFNDIESPA